MRGVSVAAVGGGGAKRSRGDDSVPRLHCSCCSGCDSQSALGSRSRRSRRPTHQPAGSVPHRRVPRRGGVGLPSSPLASSLRAWLLLKITPPSPRRGGEGLSWRRQTIAQEQMMMSLPLSRKTQRLWRGCLRHYGAALPLRSPLLPPHPLQLSRRPPQRCRTLSARHNSTRRSSAAKPAAVLCWQSGAR